MSPFKIPTNVESVESAYIGEGVHEVTIDSAEARVSSNGHDQIALEFKNAQGQTIKSWVTFSEKSLAYGFPQAFWAATGLPWPEDGNVDESLLIGRRLIIVAEPDGQYSKVTDYQPLVGSDLGYTPVSTPAPAAGGDDDVIPF